MTKKKARKHGEKADSLRRNGRLCEAGDYYTTAAYAHLGNSPPTTGLRIFHGQHRLLEASVCYRLGNDFERCVNRCQQGILIAEDVLRRVMHAKEPANFYDKARRGALYEYIGDFRTIGGLDDIDKAYDNAIEVYQNAGDPNTGYSEQEHIWLMSFYDLIANAVDENLEDKWRSLVSGTTFSEWVEYKRNRLPRLLDDLEEEGEWRWKNSGEEPDMDE